MQNSDELLKWLPPLIRRLVAEYLGDNLDDPYYQKKLDELAVLIDQDGDDTWVNISASTNSSRDTNLDTIKSFLDEPSLKDVSIAALKKCHADATREATQYPTTRLNALRNIPADVWTSKILPHLDNRSVLDYALGCRLFNCHSQQTILNRKDRKLLVNYILANNTSDVEKLLAPGLLMPYPGCFLNSPFKVAAMDRNEAMFYLLVKRLPQQNPKLYKLVYLVISNQGEMQGEEWQFEAETFLKNNDPSLIFAPGPDGLSPLQIAAADKDIHMLLALLKPFTTNPEKLEELRANLQANNALTLEEKWKICVHALLEDLPNEIQSTTLQQLKVVQITGLAYDAAPYREAYSIFDKSLSDATWYAIGRLQRTMPLHARADIYFHSHGSNYPSGAVPSYYERCGSRALKFFDGEDLFSALWGLGSSFSLVRGAGLRGTVGSRPLGRWGVAVHDSAAVARHFEVRTQQLEIIVNALELLLQKVNLIGPASQ